MDNNGGNAKNEDRDWKGRFTKGHKNGFDMDDPNINREGAPKRPSLTRALVRRLEEGGEEGGDRRSGIEVVNDMIEAAIDRACDGSIAHLKELWNRIDGKEPDRIAGHDGRPIMDEETRDRIRKIVAKVDGLDEDEVEIR